MALAGFTTIIDTRITAALATLEAARRSGCAGCIACDLARGILKQEAHDARS